MIKYENITKKYGSQTILSNINLEIEKGELVVLIGLSGSGKTTLLKMTNRLVKPSSGKIYIDGENILEKDEIALRRNIGYVIQQTGLFPHMTVRQNIELIPRLEKRKPEDIAKKSIALMEMVDLDAGEFLDRYPSQLSGGQMQRIGVARAFALDPDVILMDEPFSALDPLTRMQLQDELVDLQQKVRKTIVFVTHDMDEAVKIADKICLIDKGTIVQYDTVETLLKQPANDFAENFIGKNRIWSSPEFIRAADIMIQTPVCAPLDTSLMRCIERMRSKKVDSLFIVDDKKRLHGIINVKDIAAIGDKKMSAAKVMREDYMKVSPEENVIGILTLVNDGSLSAIPVVDNDNVLQGLITKSSLLTALSNQYVVEAEVV